MLLLLFKETYNIYQIIMPLNAALEKRVGMEFEFKRRLATTLTTFTTFVTNTVGPNTPAARTTAVARYAAIGPSMGFSTKAAAYESLKLITTAVIADPISTAPQEVVLNAKLAVINKYVGVEGEEDFVFMVEVYSLCEYLSTVLSTGPM